MTRRAAALARHALHTNLLTPLTWMGAALVLAIGVLGLVSVRVQQGAWSFGTDLLGTAYAFGAVFVVRSGLVEQRVTGMQDLLRTNLITPVEHIAAAVMSLLATWLLFSAYVFLVGLLLAGGDVAAVAWTTWLLLLTLGLLLPFVLMVECAADVRTPLFIPGFAYLALVFLVALLVGALEAMAVLGLDADRAFPRTSLPLAIRTALALGFGFTLVLIGTRLRGRRRRRLLRSAGGG